MTADRRTHCKNGRQARFEIDYRHHVRRLNAEDGWGNLSTAAVAVAGHAASVAPMANMSNWSTCMTSSRNGCHAIAARNGLCSLFCCGHVDSRQQRFIQRGASRQPAPITDLESALPWVSCYDRDDRIEVSRRRLLLSTRVVPVPRLDDPARPFRVSTSAYEPCRVCTGRLNQRGVGLRPGGRGLLKLIPHFFAIAASCLNGCHLSLHLGQLRRCRLLLSPSRRRCESVAGRKIDDRAAPPWRRRLCAAGCPGRPEPGSRLVEMA